MSTTTSRKPIALEEASEGLQRLWLALLNALLEELESVAAGDMRLRPAMAAVALAFLKNNGITVRSMTHARGGFEKLKSAIEKPFGVVVPIKACNGDTDDSSE